VIIGANLARTYTPPTVQMATPRVRPDSSRLQIRLYRYMRPLDLQCNTFLLSDGTVVTDYPVPIAGGTSSTNIPYPWDPAASPTNRQAPDFTGTPPPFATVTEMVTGSFTSPPTAPTYQEFRNSPYITAVLWGGHVYNNVPLRWLMQLAAAGFNQYIS